MGGGRRRAQDSCLNFISRNTDGPNVDYTTAVPEELQSLHPATSKRDCRNNPLAPAHRGCTRIIRHCGCARALGTALQTAGGGIADDPPPRVNTMLVAIPPAAPARIGIQIFGCAIIT